MRAAWAAAAWIALSPLVAAAQQPAEADYQVRDNGTRCARQPCARWDIRNVATRQRRSVGHIDLAPLRLSAQQVQQLNEDLAEGRFIVRGAVVTGRFGTGPQQFSAEALRVSRIVSISPGTIATRFPAPPPRP